MPDVETPAPPDVPVPDDPMPSIPKEVILAIVLPIVAAVASFVVLTETQQLAIANALAALVSLGILYASARTRSARNARRGQEALARGQVIAAHVQATSIVDANREARLALGQPVGGASPTKRKTVDVEITGDASGLTRAAAEAEKALARLRGPSRFPDLGEPVELSGTLGRIDLPRAAEHADEGDDAAAAAGPESDADREGIPTREQIDGAS